MIAACHEYAELWPGSAFAFDEQYGGQQLLQRLEKEIPTSEFISYPQDPRVMSAASMAFAELISTRKLRHPRDGQLTDHVLAGAAKFVGDPLALREAAREQKWIDALIAAVIATDIVVRRTLPVASMAYATGDRIP
jgi:hypothetical protein